MKHPMIRRGVAAVLLAGLAACSDEKEPPVTPPQPEPGLLTLRLSTPNTDDGALMLSLTGPGPLGEISAPAGSPYVVHARTSGTTSRIAVFGAVGSGDLVRVAVPDVRQAASYQVTVLEVADRTSALRSTTSGYGLSVVR